MRLEGFLHLVATFFKRDLLRKLSRVFAVLKRHCSVILMCDKKRCFHHELARGEFYSRWPRLAGFTSAFSFSTTAIKVFLVSLDRALHNDHSIDADHPYYTQNDPYDIATKAAESWKKITL